MEQFGASTSTEIVIWILLAALVIDTLLIVGFTARELWHLHRKDRDDH